MANEKKPVVETRVRKQVRVGRFKVAVMEVKKTFPPPVGQEGFIPERVSHQVRCNVQHGRKWNGKWYNQSIWCSPEELRDLVNALDGLNHQEEVEQEKDVEEQEEEEQGESPSPSFWEEHNRVVAR